MNETCCSRVQRGPSPFTVLGLGWHDGLTSGLARCKTCGQPFHFELLAWDDEQTERVYAFARIRKEHYERIVAMHDEPAQDGMAGSDRMTLATRDALAGVFGRNLYVIAEDLENEILASREPNFLALRQFIDQRS